MTCFLPLEAAKNSFTSRGSRIWSGSAGVSSDARVGRHDGGNGFRVQAYRQAGKARCDRGADATRRRVVGEAGGLECFALPLSGGALHIKIAACKVQHNSPLLCTLAAIYHTLYIRRSTERVKLH